MEALLFNPFVLGLGLGLIIAVFVWISDSSKRKDLQKEIASLKGYLNTHMSITTKGNEELKNELESLRKQNENLRITVATLQQKPGRTEVKQLHIYDRAVHLMYERSPGFSPVWESAIREAEEEIQQSESGMTGLFKKVFRPSLGSSSSTYLPGSGTRAIEDKSKR